MSAHPTGPEPTEAEMRAAYDALVRARPGLWAGWTYEATRADELHSRILRGKALQTRAQADRRARAQEPLRYQRPDGSWRTRMVYGPPTDQLDITRAPEEPPCP